MSQSPVNHEDKTELGRYVAGWNALNTMLSQGGSFSGRERNCVLLNCGVQTASGSPRYANISALSGFDFPDDARGIALVDWDHDGDLDLWVCNRTAPRLRFLRNTLEGGGQSVSILLEGVKCNRDGIGARVTLTTSLGTVVRSLCAGSGYLSQSSKWLHIGLGQDASIVKTEVDWPGGKKESYPGLTAGGRFVLKQGTGKPIPWKRASAPSTLAPAPLLALKSSAVAQVLLPRRIPTPPLTYRSGAEHKRIVSSAKPLLLILFASWCPNCRKELRDLVAHAKQLQNAGLDVLAVAVDGLDQDGPAEPGEAKKFLQEINWPFQSGTGTPQLLAKMQHLTDALFELHTPFSVPASFLLDPQRNLLALYRGPIPLNTLLHDAALPPADFEKQRDRSVPFPGKWYTMHPDRAALLELLADHFQPQFPADALHFLNMALPQLTAAGSATVQRRIAQLHFKLGSQALAANQNAQAETHYRALLQIDPKSARTYHDLGISLFNQRKYPEAEAAFLKSLELAPGNPSATRNLESVRRALQLPK